MDYLAAVVQFVWLGSFWEEVVEATAVGVTVVVVCEASVLVGWGLEAARLDPMWSPHFLEALPHPLGVQAHQLAHLLEAPQLVQQSAWVYFCYQEVAPDLF